MTAQAFEKLTNRYPEVNFGEFRLARIGTGIDRSSEYRFVNQPRLAPGYLSSACWRGYVAFYELDSSGSLLLQKFQNLAGEDQWTHEVLTGDFWMEMEHQDECDRIYVPFADGKIVPDRSQWICGTGVLMEPITAPLQLTMRRREQHRIERFVSQRGINSLFHFTRVENVAGILSRGLLGRRQLEALNAEYVANDQYRYDRIEDAVCVSITFPNYKMFYPYRSSNPGTDWAVLQLKPEILWREDCIFCRRNAAEREIAQQTITQRSGSLALQQLFKDMPGFPTRLTTDVPSNYPTHPQAEVLVRGTIRMTDIVEVFLDSEENINNMSYLKRIANQYSTRVKFSHHRKYFGARPDFEHWQRE
ncbi:MAG: DarT ssDNA thymidine ADP-ribosyltransferase family protein [Polaromonas sp.]|uniref:DarT ssDNA thymidine ADP-ribosyltransferase family protein n=1 Tax=Polaromonas sp. TaxID=1869339 RepID=UPI0027373A04|nr:DarT ssDNA thymidine ADP-ribosyltransferase family protein [Polaromonas sp.]MDP2820498.1 DarT ssDNA thymidine ADP-ribosyltransferase family protein [Polaromonas sp.]